MRHPLRLALCAVLSACGAQVAPDASAPDASSPDVTAPDSSAPDAAAPDAAAADASSPDVTAPDVTAPDAAAPDASTAQWSRQGAEICGASIVANVRDNEFALAYGYRSTRMYELHFARLRVDGTLIADTLVATGADPLCVARHSLAIDSGLSAPHTYALAAQRKTAVGGPIDLFVLDASGALIAIAERDSAVASPLQPGSLFVIHEGEGPQVVYDAVEGSQRQLRMLRWSRLLGGRGLETLSIRGRDSVPLALAADQRVVIGRSDLGGGFVATYSSDGAALVARRFDVRGWRGEPIALDRGEFIAPVWVSVTGGGDVSIAYELGVRSRTLRLVTLGLTPSTPRTIAENTAWNSLDAVRDADGQDATTWVSHRGGGFNSSVMLWRERTAAPSCPLLTAAYEQSSFTQVAQARFASRNQMIVAISRDMPVRGTSFDTLHVRALGDGELPCP